MFSAIMRQTDKRSSPVSQLTRSQVHTRMPLKCYLRACQHLFGFPLILAKNLSRRSYCASELHVFRFSQKLARSFR
jgi:hypothetical protein